MPVFNEQASVRKVVCEWWQEIENWTESFTFLCLDDGSTDNTLSILNRLAVQYGERLEIHSHRNKGHGQTCLDGYRMACARGIPHVLQIDSDGQCDPQYFYRFWRLRRNFDVVYGIRRQREDGLRRALASAVLKLSLLAVQYVYCADANVPYRLLATRNLAMELEKIPPNFFLANIALAVLLRKAKRSHAYVPIRFRERYGGEPTVAMRQFSGKAFELHKQLSLLPS